MPETRHVEIGDLTLGNDRPPVLIAGPCVLESRAHALETSRALAEMAAGLWGSSAPWPGAAATVRQPSQKVSVAAPSLMSACIGAAPVTTVPSLRSSSS